MTSVSAIPQSLIYTCISPNNPLHKLAKTNPRNMCWLAALCYALQKLGYANDKKLHYKLSYILSFSEKLLFIDKDTGSMMFPRKYELPDSRIRESLNEMFSSLRIKVLVKHVFSDIKFSEMQHTEKFLLQQKVVVGIVTFNKIKEFQNASLSGNHAILITHLRDNENGRVSLEYIDPFDGRIHALELGVHDFMQWVQYLWIMERKKPLLQKIFHKVALLAPL